MFDTAQAIRLPTSALGRSAMTLRNTPPGFYQTAAAAN